MKSMRKELSLKRFVAIMRAACPLLLLCALLLPACPARAQEGGQSSYAVWKKLADQGDSNAMTVVGMMYATGQGLPQDFAEAHRWLRVAADKGNADAQNNLGALYENGQGVKQSYKEAFGWFLKAAEKGLPAAQYNLGLLYDAGRGAPLDRVEAHKWFNLAAGQGLAAAAEARDKVARRLSKAELARAQELASAWQQGHPSAKQP